ncbi:MAG: TonB-dependent receptor [Thermodesulfobacteriota bacterium]
MEEDLQWKRAQKILSCNATTLLIIASVLGISTAKAEVSDTTQTEENKTAQAEVNNKETKLPVVTVTVNPFEDRTELDMEQPATVLKGERLRYKREPSLGDTLTGELGVASSSFGPGAGRPIIRALDGPRIQILENGMDILDVSSISPDHAVTVESLNASQIEILRGPATLLYGGGAIGGVVNVVNNKIPRRLFQSFTGNFEGRGNTATEEKSGAFNANGSIGDHISLSAGGFRRSTNDYDIPGRADKSDPASSKGTLKNSGIDSGGGYIGGSILGTRGFIGGSLSRLESEYDIPSPEMPRIDLVRNRYDAEGELDNPLLGIEKVRTKFGYTDYQHKEIENSGEVGTTFKNNAMESRTELLHKPVKGWRGIAGVQFKDRTLSALGEEAIVPKTKSRNIGVFLTEERNWDRFRLEFGGRYEHASEDPRNNVNRSRNFNIYSVSVGGLWKFIDGYSVGLSATRGQRAPTTEELYTLGPHHATETFQTGSQALKKETSNNIDVSLRKTTGLVRWKINSFYNRFNNYIFFRSADIDGNGIADRVDEDGMLDPNGEFLVQNITQTDATFYGVEAEILFALKPERLDLRLFTDYVRAKLDKSGNVPRTTPQRFGLEFNHRAGPWSFNVTTIHVLRQNKRATLETSTPNYTLVNTNISYRIKVIQSVGITVFFQGKNLLNEDIRIHTSFLKDFAPRPGRAFIAGIRGDF